MPHPREHLRYRQPCLVYPVANRSFLCDLFSILMMNGTVRVALIVLTLATGWAQGAGSKPETLVRWHFAGAGQLKQLKNQKALQEVLNLPETAALRQAALGEFGRTAAARFARGGSGANSNLSSEGIQQLLADLVEHESKFLMTASGTNAAWILAAKLPEARGGEWQKSIAAMAQNAGMKVSETPVWSATKEGYHLTLARQKAWTVLTGGHLPTEPKSIADFRRSLDKKTGKTVLDAEINCPPLGQFLGAEQLSHAPRIAVQAAPNKDGLRSEVQLEYAKSLGMKPEKWVVPTKLMNDPIIGFTAVQGVQRLLAGSRWFNALQASQTPNQVFAWSVADSPFSTFVAARVGNPGAIVTNVMNNIVPPFQQAHPDLYLGQPQFATNRAGAILRGLPIIVPFMEAAAPPDSDYLVAGLFPVSGNTNLAPAELFAQLNKKNLVYYDWEITEDRLKQILPISQLIQIVGSPTALRADSLSIRWIQAITPKLGNTVTEGTLDGERRVRIVRQSHVGLSSLELALLAHWLDPNDFRKPGEPAQGGAQMRRRPNQRPAAPRPSPAQTPQP